MKFSIVIPARDEERWLGGCLDSIGAAAAPYPGDVEIIVVVNRCTDATEAIAAARGCRIVRDDSRTLSVIRNAGARAATGDILVTIDADSRMSPDTLTEIDRALSTGRYVGGGVRIHPERTSAGIAVTVLILRAMMLLSGLAGGLYWCRRRDFEAVGGFDENRRIAEDLEFAKRLKALGAARGQAFIELRSTRITTSCRKFDRFGDWFMVRALLFHPRRLRRTLRGEDHTFTDKLFYDFKR